MISFKLRLSSLFAQISKSLDKRSGTNFIALMLAMIIRSSPRQCVTDWLRHSELFPNFRRAYRLTKRVGSEPESLVAAVAAEVRQVACPCPNDSLILVFDDTTTERYGPHVQGAGLHHNASPGASSQTWKFGHQFLTLGILVEHPNGPLCLPIDASLYVRKKDLPQIPEANRPKFQTKPQMLVEMLKKHQENGLFDNRKLMILFDGGYAKKEVLIECKRLGAQAISRLRKDADLYDLPEPNPKPRRGRKAVYGKKISLAEIANSEEGWVTETMTVYRQSEKKTFKSFVAVWKVTKEPIRVILIKESDTWVAFFSTRVEATPQEVIEGVCSRGTIEQMFKDLKEVQGGGGQQVRDFNSNKGAWLQNLWNFTAVILATLDWSDEELIDRSRSPWDKQPRRASFNDRKKASMKRLWLEDLEALIQQGTNLDEIHDFTRKLIDFACL